MKLIVNVIGATGLVGKQLVKLLLEDANFEKVRIFVRRDSGLEHPKLEQHIVDYGTINTWESQLKGDVLFSALGTTLKQAGSQEKQYEIDFTYNYNFAKKAKENGIENYVLVSSMSANSKARLFYPRIKGELEDAVAKLEFKHYSILRPGPLAGNRENKRLMEELFVPLVTFVTKFVGRKYRPIKDEIVAKAMINAVLFENTNKYIWENAELFDLSDEK